MKKKEVIEKNSHQSRREFILNAGKYAGGILAVSLLARCSDDSEDVTPTTPDPTPNPPDDDPDTNPNTINLDDFPALDTVGNVEIISIALGEVSVRRATEDSFVILSIVCTHQGCGVGWDSDNTQFACPCHGSRFDNEGNVVNGPAASPLPSFDYTFDPNENTLTVTG